MGEIEIKQTLGMKEPTITMSISDYTKRARKNKGVFKDANEYQKAALRTKNPELSDIQQLQNGLMGLNGEAGEAIDILKKCLFQGHDLEVQHLAKELGDCLWYIALAADALGYKLSDIMTENIRKLEVRYPEGFDSDLSVNRAEGDI